jgi:frataxin-like iron-binding protein CyaY
MRMILRKIWLETMIGCFKHFKRREERWRGPREITLKIRFLKTLG